MKSSIITLGSKRLKKKISFVGYLGRINFLEVFNDGNDTIGDFRFVKEGASDLFGETAAYGAE